MAIFNRKKGKKEKEQGEDGEGESKLEKFMRRPGNTAFKQQRLKAWLPILTPKSVLPTFFVIGILFAPIGGLLLWGSNSVREFSIDYSRCDTDATATATAMPKSAYSYYFGSASSGVQAPTWTFQTDTAQTNVSLQRVCTINFNVPSTMEAPVFMYYKLTNFYQNHRRYVRSEDTDQLKGQARTWSQIQGSACKPLDVIGQKVVYPCGLIANSVFNDTYSSPRWLNSPNSTSPVEYTMTQNGIAWPGESDKYQQTRYDPSTIVPPPFWAARYGNEWSASNPPPDLSQDEHFQVWMRTAGLPNFRKLWQRQNNNNMQAGQYSITIYMNYPVVNYSGTKSIVFSTVSWIGGRNPFLGIAYIVVAGLCVLIGLALTLRHLIKPRKLGDMSYLSWNREQTQAR